MEEEVYLRNLRINEIIEKYEKELVLLNKFLRNPFTRNKNYKQIIKSEPYMDNNESFRLPNTLLWTFNILGWGLIIFGIAKMNFVVYSAVLFILVSLVVGYLLKTWLLIRFCKKRKKELEDLIFLNKTKLKNFS